MKKWIEYLILSLFVLIIGFNLIHQFVTQNFEEEKRYYFSVIWNMILEINQQLIIFCCLVELKKYVSTSIRLLASFLLVWSIGGFLQAWIGIENIPWYASAAIYACFTLMLWIIDRNLKK